MSQLKVVNAPAGSGKSTEIKLRVREWSAQHPHDKMLCVTYTNRAADELKAEISTENVEVSTIHSFLSSFARSLFAAPEIIALYFEIYEQDIVHRIENADGKEHIQESNERYRNELGDPLTLDLISASVSSLYYNETSFNTLFRGGLSHDDLLSFVGACGRRFPAIYKRVSSKYNQIIIDEYQDTSVDVLEFFLSAITGSETTLHLYGDRMQQLYKSEPGRFHEIIKQFEVEARTVTNFRSSPEIVATLNKIYNDKDLQQAAHSKKPSRRPRVHFAADAEKLEALLRSESTLVLSVHNSSIFESLGSRELFRSLQAMPEHGFNSRYTAVAVLTESDWDQVQNPLVRLLYGLLLLEENFEQQLFGSAIQMIRKYPSVFGSVSLERHDDKDRLSKGFESLFSAMRKSDVTIGQVVKRVGSLDFLKPADVSGFLDDPASAALLDVPLVQVRSTYLFNKNPKRSTQHGVKGESHESVIFMAETSTGTPVVHMGKLFDLWPRIALNLRELEEFAGLMSLAFEEARAKIGVNISSLKADGFAPVAESVTAQAQAILEDYGSLPLFSELYEADFAKYLAKENVTNAKRLFKLSSVEGLLAAYRLFYVGCSRARTELDVIIPLTEITNLDASRAKFEALGFEVTVQ